MEKNLMNRSQVTATLFLIGSLFASEAVFSNDVYKTPKNTPTATLITDAPYSKSVWKGTKKKKQKLFVMESRSECRSKLKEIKNSQWIDQSVKIQADADLIVAQTKSGREGKSLISCMTQVGVNLKPDAVYRIEFDDDAANCNFRLVNTTNSEDVFDNSQPKPARNPDSTEKTEMSTSPPRSIGLKIVRKPDCDEL
jgi:hypothetical protein